MHAVGTAHVVTGLEGVFGAVRDSAMTPAARIAMATTAMAIFAGLSVKRSSNTQMLKMMLARGLMMTRSGWDTLKGPTWRADCSSSVPVMAAAARACTGQRVSMPLAPASSTMRSSRSASHRPDVPLCAPRAVTQGVAELSRAHPGHMSTKDRPKR